MSDQLAYTYQEAADAVRVGLTRIQQAVRDNEMVAKKPTPNRRIIQAAELDRWINELPSA